MSQICSSPFLSLPTWKWCCAPAVETHHRFSYRAKIDLKVGGIHQRVAVLHFCNRVGTLFVSSPSQHRTVLVFIGDGALMRKIFSFPAGGGEWEWMVCATLLHYLFCTENHCCGSQVILVFLSCLWLWWIPSPESYCSSAAEPEGWFMHPLDFKTSPGLLTTPFSVLNFGKE